MRTAEDADRRCGWCEGPLVEDPGGVRCLGGCPYQPDEVPARLEQQLADATEGASGSSSAQRSC